MSLPSKYKTNFLRINKNKKQQVMVYKFTISTSVVAFISASIYQYFII
jgi:sRNA-binding regulator protein Hfq